MAEYTAIHEAANAVVELLRREMTPEPISKPELIGLCPPHEPEDYQLTVCVYHVEEDGVVAEPSYGYVQESKDQQRFAALPLVLHLLVTPHSKAPVQTRAADEYRIYGRAIQVLRDHPLLDTSLLSGSLLDETRPLRLTLEKNMTIDQLYRFWGSSNKPYKLSFSCQLNTVYIESERVRTVGRVKRIEIGSVGHEAGSVGSEAGTGGNDR